jgi:hypothetical protein
MFLLQYLIIAILIIKNDETVKRERRLQNYLLSLKNAEELDEETQKRLSPCGSRAGIMYGLPKICHAYDKYK